MHARPAETLKPTIAVTLITGALLLVACGGARPNPSDAAAIQTAREIRDDLKKPPEERRIETLNVTKIPDVVEGESDDRASYDEMAEGDPVEVPPLRPRDSRSTEEELAAIAMAQDAQLMLLRGESERARTALETSMATYPTLDALAPLAEILGAASEDDALAAHCGDTRRVVPDARVLEVLELCYRHHSSDDVDTALGWTTPSDRTRFEAARAQE